MAEMNENEAPKRVQRPRDFLQELRLKYQEMFSCRYEDLGLAPDPDSHAEQAPKEEQEQAPKEETREERIGRALEAAIRELLIEPKRPDTEFRSPLVALEGAHFVYAGKHYVIDPTERMRFARLMVSMFPERFPDERAAKKLADNMNHAVENSKLNQAFQDKFRKAAGESLASAKAAGESPTGA